MSRSGLCEDDGDDPLAHGRWRGAVKSAINGKRGQAFLRELAAALDAMPLKVLVAGELQSENGCHCTLGVIGQKRGLDVAAMDIDDYDAIAASLDVNAKIAQEIMYENDEIFCNYEYVDVPVFGPVRPHYPEYGRHSINLRVALENPGADRWKHMRAWVENSLREPKP